jgi:hypothetical protein
MADTTLVVPLPDEKPPRRVNMRDPDSVAKYERYMKLHANDPKTPSVIEDILLGVGDKASDVYARAMQAIEGSDTMKAWSKQAAGQGSELAKTTMQTGKEPRRVRSGAMADAYNSALKRQMDEYKSGL